MRLAISALHPAHRASVLRQLHCPRRTFHCSRPLLVVKPFLLADIGEGIRECEVIQWFVEPEARVEQFDKLCEVQSDKASVEITSRFDGVIKKLHYEAGQMAIVGKPLVDIDLEEDEAASNPPPTAPASPVITSAPFRNTEHTTPEHPQRTTPMEDADDIPSKFQSLATPAVRRLTRELNINILDVPGSGKDGRVLKEDVLLFVQERDSVPSPRPASSGTASQEEQTVPLTPVQVQMLKIMTASLAIPHFLYSDEIRLDALNRVRASINSTRSTSNGIPKLTYLPFIIKAISLSLSSYPILNSCISIPSSKSTNQKPSLIHRTAHNIGVAMDTPSGLLVPNIKRVQSLSILDIAAELARLQTAGKAGRLTPADLTGGTITVSNIGNIGGTVCAPVIVPTEVAILGIGRARAVPIFGEEGENERVMKASIANFNWSADHRVVDGATMARMANLMKRTLEQPEEMMVRLR